MLAHAVKSESLGMSYLNVVLKVGQVGARHRHGSLVESSHRGPGIEEGRRRNRGRQQREKRQLGQHDDGRRSNSRQQEQRRNSRTFSWGTTNRETRQAIVLTLPQRLIHNQESNERSTGVKRPVDQHRVVHPRQRSVVRVAVSVHHASNSSIHGSGEVGGR